MLVYVYRSAKRDDLYLYLAKRDGFDILPDELVSVFGTPVFSLIFDMTKKEKLARVDINSVKNALLIDGYFLQLPPKPENLLGHKVSF